MTFFDKLNDRLPKLFNANKGIMWALLIVILLGFLRRPLVEFIDVSFLQELYKVKKTTAIEMYSNRIFIHIKLSSTRLQKYFLKRFVN
jgi:hypothetical protein